MTTTVDAVKQCRTPQEALLVLAQAIDDLKAAPAADLWEAHLDWEIPPLDEGPLKHLLPVRDNRSRIVNGDVVVDPVSSERQADRAKFAHDQRLSEFYGPSLSEVDFFEAYMKGGPRWLYYTNRECIMQMPLTLKQALVADVLLDSPSEADEIGRDICKYDESVPEGAQIEALRRDYGPLR